MGKQSNKPSVQLGVMGGFTLEARAEGSFAVPKRSVAFARSASLTFW